jgi:hypothetical protein
MTFDDGIQAAINLLSTKYPVNGGEYCSMNYLADAAGPTASAKM